MNALEELIRRDLTGVAGAVQANPEPVAGTLRAARRARRVRTGVRVSAALAAAGALVGAAALVGPGLTRSDDRTPPATTTSVEEWLDSLPRETGQATSVGSERFITRDGRLVGFPRSVGGSPLNVSDISFATSRGLFVSWLSATEEELAAENMVWSLGWLADGAEEPVAVDSGDVGNAVLSPDGSRYAYLVSEEKARGTRTERAVVRDAGDDSVVAERTLDGQKREIGEGWLIVDWNATGLVLQRTGRNAIEAERTLLWTPGSGDPVPVPGWGTGNDWWIASDDHAWASGTDLVAVVVTDPERDAAAADVTVDADGDVSAMPIGLYAAVVPLSDPSRRVWEGALGGISPDGRYVLDSRDCREPQQSARGVDIVSLDTGEATVVLPGSAIGDNDSVDAYAWDDEHVTIRIRYTLTPGSEPEDVVVRCTVPDAECRRVG
ncbi:MAG: hypothetical protein GXX79_20805 [Actinomycetales bacterium]|nr:hypothetical protein [Actinomycetales bacterium]